MKRIRSTSLAVAMGVIMLTMAFGTMIQPENINVSANVAPTTDAAGYTWIDSQGSDPDIAYDWIDATGGTAVRDKLSYYYSYYGVYYRQPTSAIALPFTFNFYSTDFDEIYLWANGMASFDSTCPAGYNYRNYGGALPDSNRNTPGNLIAALWTYGGIKGSGSANIYTLAGTTPGGTDYFVIEWHQMVTPYYYARYSYWTSYTMTFEIILYETGEIVVQWQDITGGSSYSNGRYADCGIQNADRDVGLNYHHMSYSSGTNRIRAGHAVMFKQFATDISNVTLKPGFGMEENIYPATAGQGEEYYWARADFWIETNTEDLTKIDLIIGSGSSGEGIILRYNFDTDQFAKLNDPTRYLHFDDQICAMMLDTTDPDHSGTIFFKYDFDFSWYRSDFVSIEMRIEGTGVRGT
ncbi:MAG: hypothetical protein U9R75_03765, partial [Candidatus Thermoplasmatota archaeon]|nr:hypothetical protein [Candidatus Thermoplasmatota archaeon]